MNYIISRGLILLSMALLSIGIGFGQGLYWESTTVTKFAGTTEMHYSSCYRPHMFKQWSDKDATIFRLDKEIIYSIDNERKEYSEMTFSEMEKTAKKAGGEMDAQMAELKKQLADMPAEQREAMEQMMGGKTKSSGEEAKLDVSKTGETKTLSGYKCTKYLIKENDKEFGTLWTTTSVPDFGAMQNDFKAFSQRMASLTTIIAGMTMTVTKFEKRSIAASEFEVPSGYKKVKSENFMEREHGKKRQSEEEQEQKD
jgi:hypothetical protein